jgi:hypothetical protein
MLGSTLCAIVASQDSFVFEGDAEFTNLLQEISPATIRFVGKTHRSSGPPAAPALSSPGTTRPTPSPGSASPVAPAPLSGRRAASPMVKVSVDTLEVP